MKLNLKMIAAAVALATAGQASAALTSSTLAGGSSLFLTVWNNTTNAFYVRDLGYTLNQFLDNDVTTGSGDGGVTGNKTPEAGLTINKDGSGGAVAKSEFAGDSLFSTFLSNAGLLTTPSLMRWSIIAGDSVAASDGNANDVTRVLTTNRAAVPANVLNSGLATMTAAVENAVGTSNAVISGLSGTGATVTPALKSGLSILGTSSTGNVFGSQSLYYYARTIDTGNNTTQALKTQYGNSQFFATFSLESDGDVVYNLQAAAPAAVPLPAAAWLLGSGLFGLVGVARRRKTAVVA